MIIKINEIQLFGYHGLYKEEKENEQISLFHFQLILITWIIMIKLKIP